MEQPENCCCKKSNFSVGLIIAIGLILASAIFGFAFYQSRNIDDALQVTGSATKTITSDLVKWNSGFSRNIGVNDLKSGYLQMASDLAKVKDFFKGEGIEDGSIDTSPIYMDQQYDYSKGGSNLNGYVLRQTIQIQSNDIEKITNLAKDTQKLIEQGVVFSTQSLEYYYSKLPETRVELLADAVKDAQARAEKIAQSSGKQVGALKSASVGVVQVLPKNSVDVSDYGTYDTTSIEKEVMITVRANFRIK